jgi:hypothetical protein
MKQKKIKNTTKKQVTLEGMMTFGLLETGLHTADFMCCEDVEMEAFIAKCKVQGMRDGNIYMTELPKRMRNKPLFRDDNSSLSLGRNGRYYFVFSMPQEQVDELPKELVRQASDIAQKVLRELILKQQAV